MMLLFRKSTVVIAVFRILNPTITSNFIIKIMKKYRLLLLSLIFISNCFSQSVYMGLEFGMSKSEAKKEFKKNKDDYKTIDIGNGVLYRINRHNFIYKNTKLVAVALHPKGSALGMPYDLTRNYLTMTRSFFESLNYQTLIENKWYNAPIKYLKSSSKWGLVLNKEDKNTIVQMYPMSMGSDSGSYLVKLIIWEYNTWMEFYDADAEV